ncbi:sigma-70 family RNA polymerase sigma factor [Simiduia aestuariiviva]|uniref:RNA polymerase sigma factor n=1 Tax=Simiduia aestuariiviva TaxID=1510459 RepID=A0A839UL18_9GAMM|nr:RNA polymerase sigma-70 factor (ECF subfamily) [Simiduia aestuariiviva]
METAALIKRVLQFGDQHAFAQLVQQHQSALRYSLRQWVGWDTSLADDLAQEVFLKAYRKLHQFQAQAKFSTWLYRIAYTTWLNYIDKQRVQEAPLDELTEARCDKSIQQAGAAIDIERALRQLTVPQRVAIHLCLQRGFSHGDAADIMNLPLGTVKTHVNRGREQLTHLMRDYQEAANGNA